MICLPFTVQHIVRICAMGPHCITKVAFRNLVVSLAIHCL